MYVCYIYAYIWDSIDGTEEPETNPSVFDPLTSRRSQNLLVRKEKCMVLVQLQNISKEIKSEMI